MIEAAGEHEVIDGGACSVCRLFAVHLVFWDEFFLEVLGLSFFWSC